MEGPPKFVGAKIKRREDPNLLTGNGQFVTDIKIDNMAYMAVLRSPFAHAKINIIDTSEAASTDGVIAVLTGADINPELNGTLPVNVDLEGIFGEGAYKDPPHYPLTMDKVRHVGDPVAVIVAEDADTAISALEFIFVDYDPLPVVTDAEAALADGAPVVHDQWQDNEGFRWQVSGGDVEKAFNEAHTTIEIRVINQRLIGNPIEPRAVTAQYDAGSESFTLWTSTQIPHLIRDHLAPVLGVAGDKLRTIAPDVGGGFGTKGDIYAEELLVPFLARHLKRPVHWVSTRSEDYLSSVHGRDQIDIMRLAADETGKLVGANLKVIANTGAYNQFSTPLIPVLTGWMIEGVYDVPNINCDIVGVFTNTVSVDAYRGAGRPEATYIWERAMDRLATEMGIDPVELRRRNFIPPEKFPHETITSFKYDSGEYERALDKALEFIDYKNLRQEQAQRRGQNGCVLGIGVSSYVEICGFGPWEAGGVEMEDDGTVVVTTGTSPHGQGHVTCWSQIVADALQVPLDTIVVKHGDTAVCPKGMDTYGSRSAPVGGTAVLLNAEAVREQGKTVAAHLLEAAAGDMELSAGKFHVRGVPDRSVSWQDVVAATKGGNVPEGGPTELISDENFDYNGETFPFGTHICVVEIDTETGDLKILRYVCVDDCGPVINPLIVEGQIFGGVVCGLGQAFCEAAIYDEDGNLVTGTMMDYALPKAHMFPTFESHRTETPTPVNPMGIKGIGEAATIGSAPALVNAAVDALSHLGVTNLDMPLTPERIWSAIQSSGR